MRGNVRGRNGMCANVRGLGPDVSRICYFSSQLKLFFSLFGLPEDFDSAAFFTSSRLRLRYLLADTMGEDSKQCHLCGEEKTQGHWHGKQFLCTGCNAMHVMLRRYIGSLPPLTPEEKHKFFKKAASDCKTDGRHNWTTVRATLKECMFQRKISRFAVDVDQPVRPMQYWLNLGYTESQVKACEYEDDDVLGRQYKVHQKTYRRSEIYEEVEQELLEREKEVTRKKNLKKKGDVKQGDGNQEKDEEEWDVPLASNGNKGAGKGALSAEKAAAKAAKTQEAQQRKQENSNRLLSTLAAKGISQIQPRLTAVERLVPSIQKQGSLQEHVTILEDGHLVGCQPRLGRCCDRQPTYPACGLAILQGVAEGDHAGFELGHESGQSGQGSFAASPGRSGQRPGGGPRETCRQEESGRRRS